MKRIFCLILCLFLTAAMLPPTEAFAGDEIVMAVSYYYEGDKKNELYTVFHDGWTAAMNKATDENYSEVKVTLHEDWVAKDGEFTPDFFNKKGFNWDAIHFPYGCRIMVDLNGHTIDRGLTSWEYNGEVMYINAGAEVSMWNGTIRGGFSCNGAGGIHMSGGSLELAHVTVTGNRVEDDDGAGIAVYGGELTMTGGGIIGNIAAKGDLSSSAGGLYVGGGKVALQNVEIGRNRCEGKKSSDNGGGVSLYRGELTMENCRVYENYAEGSGGGLHMTGGTLMAKDTAFTDNESGKRGGGLYLIFGKAELQNCAVFQNKAAEKGDNLYANYIDEGNCPEVRFKNSYIDGGISDENGYVTQEAPQTSSPLTGTIRAGEHKGWVILLVCGLVLAAAIVIFVKKRSHR